MPAIGPFPALFTPLFQNRQEVIVHCVHPLISGYWSAYWSNPRLRSLSGAGDFFRKKTFHCRDRSLRSRKCQVLFSVQATCHARPLPHCLVGKCMNKTNGNKLWATAVQKSILKQIGDAEAFSERIAEQIGWLWPLPTHSLAVKCVHVNRLDKDGAQQQEHGRMLPDWDVARYQ